MPYYYFDTTAGTFYVRAIDRELWALYFGDDELGWYTRADLAIQDLAQGGCKPSLSGSLPLPPIPSDLDQWTRVSAPS